MNTHRQDHPALHRIPPGLNLGDIIEEVPELDGDAPIPDASGTFGWVVATAVWHPRFEVNVLLGTTPDDTHFDPIIVNGVPAICVSIGGEESWVEQPEDTDFDAWLGVWWADRIAEEFDGFHPGDPHPLGG